VACRILVKALNNAGGNWDEPTKGDVHEVDCQAIDRQCNKQICIQVVHANVNQAFWQSLNIDGKTTGNCTPDVLVKQLKEAIDFKNRRIPKTSRQGLILALDATNLPALAFNAVIKAFHSKWGRWASEFGLR
jgi:hypothetical protein